MKRRKFLGLSVLGLIGFKPLVASAAVVGVDPAASTKDKTAIVVGSVKNPVHTLADAKELVCRLPKIGAPWPGGQLAKHEFEMFYIGARKWSCRAIYK